MDTVFGGNCAYICENESSAASYREDIPLLQLIRERVCGKVVNVHLVRADKCRRFFTAQLSRKADDAVIGIAASGTTPYVIGAVEQARQQGLLTGCITSNPDTPLAAAVDYPIETIVGPEFVTGSSRMKSGTAQKMVLNMISTSLMIRMGRVRGNRMVKMQLKNAKLVDRGTRMLQEFLGLDYEEAQRRLLDAGSVDGVLREEQAFETTDSDC